MAVTFGEFEFELGSRELRCRGSRLRLDPKLLDLLAYFVSNPGRLLSKRELLDRVWEGRAVAENVLSVSVAKLRKALGHEPGRREFIENRYGRGYCFIAEVTVLDGRDSQRSPAASLGVGMGAPLVGRNGSLQRLESALERARAGRGGLCVVSGEPGIGKTRLAEALEERALERGLPVVWGRCLGTEGTPPLWPFTQVLRALRASGLIDADSPLPGSASKGPQSAETLSVLHRNSLYDGMRANHHTLDFVAQTLFTAAQRGALLIILDDLHWADAASVRLLRYLAGELGRRPLLIIATRRSTDPSPDDATDRDLRQLYAHAHCERIELERLSHGDVDDYLARLFGARDRRLAQALFERSEGNPFFMVELLRPWLGQHQPRPEQLQVTGAALELVRERLRDLPAVSREVLSAAAVIGQSFDLGLLSHVTQRPGHVLLEALDSSMANDTIVASQEQQAGYAFNHHLIREVLYDELPAHQRCALHARAGDGLARRRAHGDAVTSAELAHHFLTALPCGDVKVAVGHAREAAASATIIGAHRDARALLLQALASLRFAVEPDPETHTALLLELAIVERVLGDPAYIERLQHGVSLARSLRLGSMLALAGRFLSPGPGMLVKADANAVLEAAAEVLPQDAYSERALVLAHLSWTPPNCWSAKQVAALLAQAKELAQRSDDREALGAVRDAELYYSGLPDMRERADALAREVEREQKWHPARVGLWRAVYTAIYRLASGTQRGDQAAADQAIAELTQVHGRLQNPEIYWHHARLMLIQRMNRGQWSGLSEELEHLRERARSLRLHAWRAISACDQSTYLRNTGDPHALLRSLRPDLAPVVNDLPNSRSLKIRLLAEHGFLDDARDALAQVSPEALRDLPYDRDYLAVLADLTVAAVAVDSRTHCSVLYELLKPHREYYAIGMSFHCQGSLSYYLGILARVLGDEASAYTYLCHGVEQNRRMGLLPRMLDNQLDLATLLITGVAVRDVERGRALLTDTARRACELGMPPLQHAAEAWLARS